MISKIVAIQGNHPSKLNSLTDTSVFLAHEIQKKKYKIFYYDPKDFSVGIEQFNKNDYDMRLGGSGGDYDPDDGVVDWMQTTSKFNGRARNKDIHPFGFFSSAEADAAIAKQSVTADPTERKKLVQEAKKKYVAGSQGWNCAHCKEQLKPWFEVDHILRLEYGGTNDISNLEALCRECHGKKTSEEHLNIL